MSYELLLEWASDVGSGAWETFRDTHDWLFEPAEGTTKRQQRASTAALNLSTLGHLEVDWQGGAWAVAPPVLTILPHAGAHAILSGSRTRTLLTELERTTSSSADLFVDRHPQAWGPDAYFIAGSDETGIEELARTLGIRYEPCISERLAELLPPLDSYLELARSTPPAKGYGVKKFNPTTLFFSDTTSDDDPGLYEYGVNRRSEYRWSDGTGAYYALDRSTAMYAELRRCGKTELRYQPSLVNGTLTVPFRAPLPALHARTAALCCGLMPSLEQSLWHYPNVPRATARRIGDALGQEVNC